MAAPSSAAVIFFDDFDSGASTAWGNQRGNWRDTGGVYDAANPDNTPTTYSDVTTFPALTDFVVDVDVNDLDDGGVWLRSNFNGGNINGVLLVTGGFGGSNNGFYWHTSQNGGIGSVQNAVAVPGLQGSDRHLTIVVSGDTYSLYLDGGASPITTFTTSLFASGAAGLYDFSPTSGASSPSGQTFDNFQISVAVPEPAASGLLWLGAALLALSRRRRR